MLPPASSLLVALVMTTTCSPPDQTIPCRATAAQIRRAAGGSDLSHLQALLSTGWTSADLNSMASSDGKGAVHMAAWRGTIEILDYLIREYDCDIDSIATGNYSYGKTPLFFACTRSRDIVVMYLLQHTNANVRIVNNKGQSVLSIASSHLKPSTIRAIQNAEERQASDDKLPWINYRQTHSDHLEYGDLDPRFLDRPLRSTDVVTPLAINPTTRESRRGNFARKNPQAAKELTRRQEGKHHTKKLRPEPTREELDQLDSNWGNLERALQNHTREEAICAAQLEMLEIVHCGEKQKRAWLPTAVERLRAVCRGDVCHISIVRDVVKRMSECSTSDRQLKLLQKWVVAAVGSVDGMPAQKQVLRSNLSRRSESMTPISLSSHAWSAACQAVEGIAPSVLQQARVKALTLPDQPVWVDNEQGVADMLAILHTYVQRSSYCAIGLDTEWATSRTGDTVAATIQIALAVRADSRRLHTWVVDLHPHETTHKPYHDCISAFLSWIFLYSNAPLLGFAFANDIPKLRPFLPAESGIMGIEVLDIQLLAAPLMKRGKTMLPGLQACAAHFLSSGTNGEGGYFLSKEQQCSEWGSRPLRPAQLEYAGLDAAVLLVLLAEIAATHWDDTLHHPNVNTLCGGPI